jgi:hypothetical protein
LGGKVKPSLVALKAIFWQNYTLKKKKNSAYPKKEDGRQPLPSSDALTKNKWLFYS